MAVCRSESPTFVGTRSRDVCENLDTEKFIVGRILPDHFGGDASTDIGRPCGCCGPNLAARFDGTFGVFTEWSRLRREWNIINGNTCIHVSVCNYRTGVCKFHGKFNRLSSYRWVGFEREGLNRKGSVAGTTRLDCSRHRREARTSKEKTKKIHCQFCLCEPESAR
jgi:hypothetical protein